MNPEDCILITVDVEDWFQVENFKRWIPYSSWPSYALRVDRNTCNLLDFFDSFNTQNGGRKKSVKATFFILGWLAERLPGLVRKIVERGHEIASHGYGHELCTKMTRDRLDQDLIRSKKLIEDIAGVEISGYRAPSFAIDNRILEKIRESGYLYDSSYNSFALHGRYGRLKHTDRIKKKGIALEIADGFYEMPISNIKIGGHTLPWGGGGYFRMIPLWCFKIGMKLILRADGAYMFYMHPWEIDPDQPRMNQAAPFFRFRHYINLGKTAEKLFRMIDSSTGARFVTCREYLEYAGAAA